MPLFTTPFGEADCEAELERLQNQNIQYSSIYFDETPFNSSAIDTPTYLIVGRRGSGKTALAQYFSFQETIKSPLYIAIRQPDAYHKVMSEVGDSISPSREIALPAMMRVWEYVLWSTISEHVYGATPEPPEDGNNAPSLMIHRFLASVKRILIESDEESVEQSLRKLTGFSELSRMQEEAIAFAKQRPIIVAMDTLERYESTNDGMMNAIGGLIQYAARFNLKYSERGIHLKVLMSGEIFPHLQESVIQNTLKYVKEPVYLFWRPKDLLRLISWRFYNYLKGNGCLRPESQQHINWTSYDDVLRKMWTPYFGEEVVNGRGIKEHSFPYVLRHTQMRPRQLILLCNGIAKLACHRDRLPEKLGTVPQFLNGYLCEGVKRGELGLADEAINSFVSIYPEVTDIVSALDSMPMHFLGNALEERAHQSAKSWPPGLYSPAAFVRLVAELGIVGRVKKRSSEEIDAVFEYSIAGRLPITHRTECVIHPMYYSKLNVQLNVEARVRPVVQAENLGVE